AALWEEAGHPVARPFPRITWREAMERYGTDKPDLRFELAIADWTAQVAGLGVPFFESGLKNGARVRGLAVKGGAALSRKDVDQLVDAAKQLGGSGLAWVKRQGEQLSGSVAKHFTPAALGALGSGSSRITGPAGRRKGFALLGLAPADVDARFRFLLQGLQAGAPPHGGFAIGFDRVVMALAGADSMRDVIAFPKTTAARALFEGAPGPANAADLAALHIEVKR